MGIWPVANGEAMSFTFYDPKAVETLEMTIQRGWWAELGLPPVKAMSRTDLDGLAGKRLRKNPSPLLGYFAYKCLLGVYS